ncbi:MAG: SH3 domain-containing protein [Candidatus Omnitrophica bacterium]|nr:SH3 domain-containing protein [Candidatus Omnitrophota bacterium]
MLLRTILFLFLVFINSLIFGEDTLGRTKQSTVVRTDSTLFSEEIGHIPKNTILEIIKEKYDWFKVKLPENFFAFVYADYIEEIGQKKGECKADHLNIRAKPTLKSPIIGRLKKDDRIEIVEKVRNWYKINAYPYSWGWVHKNSIEIISEKKISQLSREEGEKLVRKTKEVIEKKVEEEVEERLEEESQSKEILTTELSPEEVPEQQIKEQPSLPELLKEEEPLAKGILKKENRLFSIINYRLENENGIVFLRIPHPLSRKAMKLLNKKVKVWGVFKKKKSYLVVSKISLGKDISEKHLSEEKPEIKQENSSSSGEKSREPQKVIREKNL